MSAQTSPVARRDSRTDTNVVVWASISTVGVLLAGIVLLIALSLLSWATDRPAGASTGSAARVAFQAWYLAHSVSLPVSWGSLSVPPLLVTGYIALLFYRSGRGAVRSCGLRTPGQIAEALAAIVITYVTCAILLSSVAYPSGPLLSIWDIVLGTGTLSFVASLSGLLRESGLGSRLVARLPGPSYAYTRGVLAAGWSLAAISAILVGGSLLINFSEASALTAALSPSGLGGLTVGGISIGYLPNAMLLATALGSGAGFNLGDGSLYTLTSVDREALPIFPLFAALPHDGGGLALLSVLIPLIAAVVGALTMTRHLEPEHRTATNLVVGSVLCGVLTAVAVLGIALYATGGLGDGRLSEVGASPWRVAGFLALELVVVVAVVAFVATRRSLKPADVVRRERALAVLETGEQPADAKSSKGSTKKAAGSKQDAASAKDGASATAKGGAEGSAATAAAKGSENTAAKGGAKGPAATDSPDQSTKSMVGAASEGSVGSPERKTDEARRPVVASKLAMRRLANGGKQTAKAQNAAALKKQPTAAPKTAPAASLSVVKRARTANARPAPTEDDATKAAGPAEQPE